MILIGVIVGVIGYLFLFPDVYYIYTFLKVSEHRSIKKCITNIFEQKMNIFWTVLSVYISFKLITISFIAAQGRAVMLAGLGIGITLVSWLFSGGRSLKIFFKDRVIQKAAGKVAEK
ncbi:MAG: hypothetical protein KAI88_05185 [Nitrosomonadaceae bacterium]|nr:hypothetical protein [Nitrosomonadaceae bacterium]